MAKIVCVDALVYWNSALLSERNEATVNQDVTVAEAKPFVASMSLAYAAKTPTWKTWTCTLNGYYDDADNSLQNAIAAGTKGTLLVYPTRTSVTHFWSGTAFVRTCKHGVNPNDYSTLDCDFEGDGVVVWNHS
jgi:hypothetical protein